MDTFLVVCNMTEAGKTGLYAFVTSTIFPLQGLSAASAQSMVVNHPGAVSHLVVKDCAEINQILLKRLLCLSQHKFVSFIPYQSCAAMHVTLIFKQNPYSWPSAETSRYLGC
jgi:hypothetical protein